MAVANVIRLSILGAMPSGEVWSVNPVWQIGGVSTAEDISQTEAQTMVDAANAKAIPAGLYSSITSSVSFTGIRLEARRWDGTLAAQAQAMKSTPFFGSSGTAHPYQTSSVTSLRSGHPGATGRGRLYWPATGMALATATLRPTTATVDGFLAGVKTYLTSLTDALAVTLTNAPVLSVWSRTTGATHPVTEIKCGDVMDVQRRRRDNLIEGYSAVSWP